MTAHAAAGSMCTAFCWWLEQRKGTTMVAGSPATWCRHRAANQVEIEVMLTSVPNPSNPPAPSLASTRPSAVCTLTCDNDPQYSVSSYGTRKRTAEQAKVTQANASANPHTDARADAIGWEAACEAERRAVERRCHF